MLATKRGVYQVEVISGFARPPATDLQNRAVGTIEMLPADATGMLNIAYEIDAGGEHSSARDIKIVDPERDHRACGDLLIFDDWGLALLIGGYFSRHPCVSCFTLP
jgi:hypothetical protein